MLERKALRLLKEWKRTKGRDGLLVTGARQVGKTWLIERFAESDYRHFAKIDLIADPKAATTLALASNPDDLFTRISLLANTELVPKETLIFIDEVQVSKELVTAIKYLANQDDYDFILSGSLLGVELKDIRSVPVGYLQTVSMYPLDFEEFATARGVPDSIFSILKESFHKREPVPDYIHERLIALLHEYLIIGGMPAAVDEFCNSGNLQTVRRIQENIILRNREDISKYNPAEALVIKDIYDLVPAELNSQNRRFVLRKINEYATYNRYRECFVWLTDAGVALPAYNVSEPVYPLKLSQSSNLFKLFMNDVGLLTSTFIKDTSLEILNRNPNVNYGSIYENLVAQELVARGFELYYFRSKKRGELDFVTQTAVGTILPFEVKSGKDYKRHSALTKVLESDAWPVSEGYVICEDNISLKDKVVYLPAYLLFCFVS